MFDRRKINQVDLMNTETELKEYNSKDEASIIFLQNGMVQSVNNEFKKIFIKDETAFDDMTFFQLFEPKNRLSKSTQMMKQTSGKYVFNIFGKKLEVDVNLTTKTLVVQRKRIYDGKTIHVAMKCETTFV